MSGNHICKVNDKSLLTCVFRGFPVGFEITNTLNTHGYKNVNSLEILMTIYFIIKTKTEREKRTFSNLNND